MSKEFFFFFFGGGGGQTKNPLLWGFIIAVSGCQRLQVALHGRNAN